MSNVIEVSHLVKNFGEVVEAIKDSVDCNIYFMDEKVLRSNIYSCLITATVIAVFIYVMINSFVRKKTV